MRETRNGQQQNAASELMSLGTFEPIAAPGATLAAPGAQVPDGTVLASDTAPGTVVDGDGTSVSLSIAGNGHWSIIQATPAPTLSITGIDASSAITIATTGGDGRFLFSGINVGGSAASLTGSGAGLNGGLTLNGTIKTLHLGDLTVDAGSAVVLSTKSSTSVGALTIGETAVSTLTVNGGSTLTSGHAIVGDRSGSGGSAVTVSGAGSSWQVNGGLIVGEADGGAQLSLNTTAVGLFDMLTVGDQNGGGGIVSVVGAGTKLSVAGRADFGAQGNGLLNMQSGAVVTFGEAVLGDTAGSLGQMTLTGAGTTENIVGTLTIGGAGTAVMTIGGGATVNAGALSVGSNDLLTAAGVAAANGNTVMNVAGAFVNQGTILANGPAGTNVTINVQQNPLVQFANNGTIQTGAGSLTINNAGGPALSNAGTLIANGGTLTLTGDVTDSGSLMIGNNSTLRLGGAVAAGTPLAFGAGGNEVLALDNTKLMQGTINGFAAGDTITLSGFTITGSLYFNGGLTLNTTSGNIVLNLPGSFTTNKFSVNNLSGGAQVAINSTGVPASMSISQQLELIYIAYFNRAADTGGFFFWNSQNFLAQNSGQSAALAMTNIANSFTPQQETIALYPFLGSANLNLNTPQAQAGLTSFINALYGNLFGRAPDLAGLNYWVGQVTSGAVGLGAAALAIALGATGHDSTEMQNKISVALDFTNRTGAANQGLTYPLPASFLTAARSVLSGVDGVSLDDASVTAEMAATTSFIAGSTTTHAEAQLSTDPITISASSAVIDPGPGNHTIQFLAGSTGTALVLHAGAVDTVSGFDPKTDILDIRSLLAEANVDLNGGITTLEHSLTIADQGPDALLRFDPSGVGGLSVVAVLLGLGGTVNEVNTLLVDGSIRIA